MSTRARTKDTPEAGPFGPGFERDTRALAMLYDMGLILKGECRENLKRLGVELVDRVETPDPPKVRQRDWGIEAEIHPEPEEATVS